MKNLLQNSSLVKPKKSGVLVAMSLSLAVLPALCVTQQVKASRVSQAERATS